MAAIVPKNGVGDSNGLESHGMGEVTMSPGAG